MDNKYITLFKDLAQATASTAEVVMEYDHQKNDEQGLETATIMRNDYQNLMERIETTEDYTLNKADVAKLLVAAMIQVNQIQDRIHNLKSAMTGYQSDIIPKLQELIDIEDDETISKLANEKFIIENNE